MKVQPKANPAYQQLVIALSRDIVTQTAPEELPLFRAISDSYSKNPDQTLRRHRDRDEDLGFGVAEAALLLTPVVLSVMNEVVKYLINEITKSVKEESAGLISNRIKSMFKKYKPGDAQENQALALNSEQLRQVRQLSFEKARQLALSEDQARLLADAIAGSLAIAP